MKSFKIWSMALLLIIGSSCKKEKETEQSEASEIQQEDVKQNVEKVESVTFNLNPKSDSGVNGSATFMEDNGTVTMVVTLSGLTEGKHAIHLHEKADCSSADGKSTGGHWNPTGQPHGKWGDEAGYHKGDIGNFTANAEGNAKVKFSTDEWCLGCDDDSKNIIGKAVIVHQGVDDFTSQPSGAAGSRISCGGIIQ